ncbi:uncharacterized protein J4E84_006601 [Alternaria hordeiaustralica]|uniref:uncharacterized protein n=1 Tax=Alternaria hordeiaustralica TaxID=1187925 RepID=UPI0020C46FD0|nr:uncharacterized protein J4E84_006601 [Alternaria hordeiaustralica]KAI4683763.1 hypothetical protein J4E84_006601 [Alternaria hordeiaustralica]
METSKQRLRRAMRLAGPTIGLKRSQTDTTNGQAHLRPGYQAEGGVETIAADLLLRRPMPPSLQSRGEQRPTMAPDTSSFPDRWAEIRRKAELRQTSQGVEQNDGETQDEETIESRVARIKARVAELTDSVEGGVSVSVSAERNEERPLMLHTRRHTAGNIISSANVQSTPRRNDIYMEPVDFDDASSEPSFIKPIEASTRTLSADGSDLTSIERDPFCRPWDSESITNHLLSAMDVASARVALESLGVTDLWLPLSKQLLKRSLSDPHHVSEFLRLQEGHLRSFLAFWTRSVSADSIHDTLFNHCEFEDDEEVFEENRLLGEGMVGLVEEVTVRGREPPLICVRKKIARPKQLKAHRQIMAAFIREIKVMRQVDHRHCVRFLGSYTDNESVNILSTPVADMDLATFLDKPLGDREWAILYKGIDCLCNGLLYLHDNKIRHEDLKPQNVLVHGTNILLTDFGFR